MINIRSYYHGKYPLIFLQNHKSISSMRPTELFTKNVCRTRNYIIIITIIMIDIKKLRYYIRKRGKFTLISILIITLYIKICNIIIYIIVNYINHF